MKVLITAPLRQDKNIFQEHQEALDNLVTPNGVVVDRHYIVNDCNEVIPYIHGTYEVCDTGDKYEKTDNDHIWMSYNLAKMHDLRNRTVKAMLDGGYDYWWSIDTDVVVQPETLSILLDADKDIVSEIFWTNGWCNAWMYDQAHGMPPEWHEAGLYQVGMTGACTLVKRKVFEAGVDFTPIPCIHQALIGEDRHFCVRAACAGFELWVDTHYPAEHLYTQDVYREFMERKERAND